MTAHQALNLAIAGGTIVLGALFVAALGGLLQRYAKRTADERMHRAYDEAPLTAADEPVAAETLAWVAAIDEQDDSQAIDVRRLIARQDYEAGLDWVRDMEARLAVEQAPAFGFASWAGAR